MGGAASAMTDALAGRWQTTVVLKRDVFSTVERGTFRGDGGDSDSRANSNLRFRFGRNRNAEESFGQERAVTEIAKNPA